MRLSVEAERCQGHAQCRAHAPDLIEFDDDGHACALDRELDGELAAAARMAVEACPERALGIVG
jgi:ferredoxin